MHCHDRCEDRCDRMPHDCCEPVAMRQFDCGKTQRVIRHQHVVKHQHDIINEYDVIHEHEFNYFDVVREREVVRHNDCTHHEPNYCGDECDNECARPARRGNRFFRGRRFW